MSETRLDTEPRKAFWRDIVIACVENEGMAADPASEFAVLADDLLEEYDKRCGYLPKEQGEPND